MITKLARTAARSFSTTNAAAAKPTVKPSSPDFSSGPCKKRPGWTVDALSDGALGRSHRSALGKAKLKKCIEDQKRILGIPDDYHLGIVPVSYLRCCFCVSLISLMFFFFYNNSPPRSGAHRPVTRVPMKWPCGPCWANVLSMCVTGKVLEKGGCNEST